MKIHDINSPEGLPSKRSEDAALSREAGFSNDISVEFLNEDAAEFTITATEGDDL